MSNIEQTIFCFGCGTEVYWAPIMKNDKPYCCQDCLEGRGCDCHVRQDLEDDRPAPKAASSLPNYS